MVKRQLGWTLSELMIALVIVGVLVGMAYPLYFAYVRKGRMYDAQQALLDNVRGLEKHYSLHYRFKKDYANWADLTVTQTDYFCIKMQGNPRGVSEDQYTIKAVAFDKKTEPRVLVINQDQKVMQCENSTSTCDEGVFFSAPGRVDTDCVTL